MSAPTRMQSRGGFSSYFKRKWQLYAMLLLPAFVVLLFNYVPLYGLVIAFKDFNPGQGMLNSPWVGMKWFKTAWAMPDFSGIVWNTFIIAVGKIVFGQIAAILFALLLNEVRKSGLKRTYQTMVYLPNFLSWIILSGIFVDILSPSSGIVGRLFTALGGKAPFFLGDSVWFPITMVVTDVWKNFGFQSVIYLAALTGVDPALYESASIDGAGRWRQTWHITLPGILSTIVLMTVLSMADILNGGFDQIYNLYSPAVYSTGDILDTFVYRLGIERTQFALSTAAGLFKSGVSLVFITASYWMADRFAGYRIF